LAKAKKPLSEGELVKTCAIEMANAFGNEKMAKHFETVSLSRRTVTRRMFDIQTAHRHQVDEPGEVLRTAARNSRVFGEQPYYGY
ncbi:hypothetical protein KUCAC02_019399, partial [Chaenocephalus aceratus]